jgi:hypothetical protein
MRALSWVDSSNGRFVFDNSTPTCFTRASILSV